MLGYLFRCLYYHEHRCVSGGWCKISWIAKVFCMDQRNIKAARKHLVTIGWLCLCDTPQAVCNRWGIYGQVNLSWTRAVLEPATQDTAATPCTGSPPPAEFSTTKLPPLYKEHTEPLQEYKHQNPVPPADTAHAAYPVASAALPPGTKTGVQIQPANGTKTSFLPPTLQHIVPDDLRDTARLLTLFAQAQQHGLIDGSDSARLTFVAMAEHAHGLGTANPCGLFAALVRRQCWHYITDRDEDAASARLKQYWYGRAGPRPSAAPPRVAAPPLSKDAFMVRELQRELTRAGFQGEAFAWVHRAYPEWTRVRWDLAVAELTTAQQGWQRINAGTSLDACAQVLDSSWAA
jgi:hypothetical protein